MPVSTSSIHLATPSVLSRAHRCTKIWLNITTMFLTRRSSSVPIRYRFFKFCGTIPVTRSKVILTRRNRSVCASGVILSCQSMVMNASCGSGCGCMESYSASMDSSLPTLPMNIAPTAQNASPKGPWLNGRSCVLRSNSLNASGAVEFRRFFTAWPQFQFQSRCRFL